MTNAFPDVRGHLHICYATTFKFVYGIEFNCTLKYQILVDDLHNFL